MVKLYNRLPKEIFEIIGESEKEAEKLQIKEAILESNDAIKRSNKLLKLNELELQKKQVQAFELAKASRLHILTMKALEKQMIAELEEAEKASKEAEKASKEAEKASESLKVIKTSSKK